MKQAQKKEIHLQFDLDDERQRQAYELLMEKSSSRKRTDFISDAILATHNNSEIARLMADIIASELKAGRKPAQNASLSGDPTTVSRRPRGRPRKNPIETVETIPAPQPVLSPAVEKAAAITEQSKPAVGEDKNNILLDEILSAFG